MFYCLASNEHTFLRRTAYFRAVPLLLLVTWGRLVYIIFLPCVCCNPHYSQNSFIRWSIYLYSHLNLLNSVEWFICLISRYSSISYLFNIHFILNIFRLILRYARDCMNLCTWTPFYQYIHIVYVVREIATLSFELYWKCAYFIRTTNRDIHLHDSWHLSIGRRRGRKINFTCVRTKFPWINEMERRK